MGFDKIELDYNSSENQVIDLDSNKVYKMCHHGSVIAVLAAITVLACGVAGYQWYRSNNATVGASASSYLDEEVGEEEITQIELADGTIVKSSFDTIANSFYAKNGKFISDLITSIRYTDNYSHAENALYANESITADELPDTYRNNLVYRQLIKDALADVSAGFSVEQLANASIALFGKNYFETTYDLVMNCAIFHRDLDSTDFVNAGSYSCDGKNYHYYAYTTKVEVAKTDIYIYQKVAFQGDGEDSGKLYVYANITNDDNDGYLYDGLLYETALAADTWMETREQCEDVTTLDFKKNEETDEEEQVEGTMQVCADVTSEVADESFQFQDFDISANLDLLTEYRYTFSYDSLAGGYVFKSITRV